MHDNRLNRGKDFRNSKLKNKINIGFRGGTCQREFKDEKVGYHNMWYYARLWGKEADVLKETEWVRKHWVALNKGKADVELKFLEPIHCPTDSGRDDAKSEKHRLRM